MSNKKNYTYGIFIFRKDLRIVDNRGLVKLAKECDKIIPVFIFDPYQVDLDSRTKNYLSYPALRFICEGVKDLNKSIGKTGLNVFYGTPVEVLKHIVGELKIDSKSLALGFNADFTEYSIKRDNEIRDFCKKNNINVVVCEDDNTLCDMNLFLKEPEIPYKQYGAFKKNMLEHKDKFNKVDNTKIKFFKPTKSISKTLTSDEIDELWEEHMKKDYKPLEVGSRKLGLDILSKLNDFKDYNTKRDILSYSTTHLSAYLNFGLISERELYWALVSKLGNTTQLINQVIWREYYICILRYLQGASSYSLHIDPRYNKIKWVKDTPNKNSKAWKEWELMMGSKTGFLLVDAAIQELLNTGFMHNRCRMIVGVFSVKYLGINPLCRYIGLNDWFSRHLVDCSTSQNKLNTQWVTELDFPGKKFAPSNAPIAGRPMNISNLMIKKWDPDCIYIKRWLPHLATIDNKILYNWDTKYNQSIHPKPIFDYKTRYAEWIEMCKS